MSSTVCRLCNLANTKLANSINDEIIVKFIRFVPQISLSDDSSLPKSVCQLCYGKAKISCDFIHKSIASQRNLIRQDHVDSVTSSNGLSGNKVQDKADTENEITFENDEFSGEEAMEADNYSDTNFDPLELKEKETANRSRTQKEVYISAPVTFTCAMCKITFPSFLKLSVHMKQRNCGTAQFVCQVCKKECLNRRALTKHKVTHRPKHRLMCDGCGKEFNSQFDLDFHTEVVHGRVVNEGITYRCSHCPDTFNSHINLMAHVKKHKQEIDEESRLCEICAKECPNLRSYRTHISSHKNRKFVCDICDKAFQRSFKLVQHSHVHTGIKSFKCNLCSRAFAKQDSLRCHTKKEHGY